MYYILHKGKWLAKKRDGNYTWKKIGEGTPVLFKSESQALGYLKTFVFNTFWYKKSRSLAYAKRI